MLQSMLEAESGAVLPARDTLFIVSLASVSSRVYANSNLLIVTNKAAANSVAAANGSTVSVWQSVSQGVN